VIAESTIPLFPDLRLDYGFVSDYTFRVDKPEFSVFLKSDEKPTVDNRKTTFDLSLTTEDAKYFKFNTAKLDIDLSDNLPA